jgi:exosome complex RNA-binding protein Rrp4
MPDVGAAEALKSHTNTPTQFSQIHKFLHTHTLVLVICFNGKNWLRKEEEDERMITENYQWIEREDKRIEIRKIEILFFH